MSEFDKRHNEIMTKLHTILYGKVKVKDHTRDIWLAQVAGHMQCLYDFKNGNI